MTEPETAVAAPRRKVLVVEDDAVVLGLITKIVDEAGYEAVGAPTGEAALAAIANANRSQAASSCSSTRAASRPSAGEKQSARRAEPATSAAAVVSRVATFGSPGLPGSASAITTVAKSPSGKKPKIS